MNEKEVLKLFEAHNALLKGHFRLSSGLHSERYLQCALVLQHPKIAEKLAAALAARFAGDKVDIVVGPALGGITLAYEVARAIGARGIFAEREGGKMCLRRGFSIAKGEKALVVEDVVTTGGSTKEVIDLVKASDGKVVAVGMIINRNQSDINFGVKQEALAKVRIETFKPEDCPLCKSNIPIVKPGSR